MATAQLTRKTRQEYVPATYKDVVESAVELTLTLEEASTLMALVGHIGGASPEREQTSKIYDALWAAGVSAGTPPRAVISYDEDAQGGLKAQGGSPNRQYRFGKIAHTDGRTCLL